MKNYWWVVLMIVIAGVGFLLRQGSNVTPAATSTVSPTLINEIAEPQPVVKQAAFAIYTSGTFRIFTASMYHNLSEDVFIQAENPNIIQVKKDGVT